MTVKCPFLFYCGGSRLDVAGSLFLGVVHPRLDVVGSSLDLVDSWLYLDGCMLYVVDSRLDVVGSSLDVVGPWLYIDGCML